MVICSPLAYTLPQVLAKTKLLQRVVGRGGRCRVAVADHAAGVRVEITLTGLARRRRIAVHGVRGLSAANVELVTALGARLRCATKHAVQKTSSRGGRCRTRNRSEVNQCRREASIK